MTVLVVSVTSPSKVYIRTNAKCPYYSENDETPKKLYENVEDKVKFIDILEQSWWLSVRTVLRDGEFEIQDLVAFIGMHLKLLYNQFCKIYYSRISIGEYSTLIVAYNSDIWFCGYKQLIGLKLEL